MNNFKSRTRWRVVTIDGRLNEKFPGGAKEQAKRLKSEGHTIERDEAKSHQG